MKALISHCAAIALTAVALGACASNSQQSSNAPETEVEPLIVGAILIAILRFCNGSMGC